MATMIEVRLAAANSAAVPMEVPTEPAAARRAAGQFARKLPAGRSVLAADGLAGARLAAVVEGLVLGTYRYTERTAPEPAPTLVEPAGAADTEALDRGLRAAAATVWARDLTNT